MGNSGQFLLQGIHEIGDGGEAETCFRLHRKRHGITQAGRQNPVEVRGDLRQQLEEQRDGSGAMVVSHANDSYFWVVTQFSDMNLSTAYKAQTMATLIQGIVAVMAIYGISLYML